jgi:hypothetical protein
LRQEADAAQLQLAACQQSLSEATAAFEARLQQQAEGASAAVSAVVAKKEVYKKALAAARRKAAAYKEHLEALYGQYKSLKASSAEATAVRGVIASTRQAEAAVLGGGGVGSAGSQRGSAPVRARAPPAAHSSGLAAGGGDTALAAAAAARRPGPAAGPLQPIARAPQAFMQRHHMGSATAGVGSGHAGEVVDEGDVSVARSSRSETGSAGGSHRGAGAGGGKSFTAVAVGRGVAAVAVGMGRRAPSYEPGAGGEDAGSTGSAYPEDYEALSDDEAGEEHGLGYRRGHEGV